MEHDVVGRGGTSTRHDHLNTTTSKMVHHCIFLSTSTKTNITFTIKFKDGNFNAKFVMVIRLGLDPLEPSSIDATIVFQDTMAAF